MQPDYFGEMGGDYAVEGDTAIGVTTAVEQTTGSKNSFFQGFGRNVSVGTYQWLIVVGAVALLWALGKGLASDLA